MKPFNPFPKRGVPWLFMPMSLILMIVIAVSCKKDAPINSQTPVVEELPDIEFPLDFGFATYQDITIDFSDAQMGVYRIYGKYHGERDLLGTAKAEGGRLLHHLQIPIHYTDLEVERYTRTQMDVVHFALTGGTRVFAYDYNTYRKDMHIASTAEDVLYAVNSNKDFLVVHLNDFSTTDLPDLLAGTIACAVDTISDKVYYHASPNMYEYNIATGQHSVSSINPNPFNSNYPRMEYDHESGHLFISNNTTIYEVDPISGLTLRTFTINGIVNTASGGDLAFPPNGKRYLACFSGLYELEFPLSGNVVNATRLSAENMPYQLTSLGYDRNSFLYAATNEAQSKLLKMDPADGSFLVAMTFPMTINDLGSIARIGNGICSIDSDNDGICDELDDHPNDPEVAFDEFTPSELGYGSVAFEDMWPGEGDYDYNDLVVGYRYIQMRNAANELVRLHAKFFVRAVGASFSNGFGFQLNVDPSIIANVSGGSYAQGIVNLDANGLEAGQSTPTVIVFESAFDVIDHNGGPYINTDPNIPISLGDTLEIIIQFTEPQADLSIIPINPFLFVDGQRSHEVHLADGDPTDLVDVALFGQQEDASDPANQRYYRNANNLPWGIEVAHTFRHPVEKVRIDEAYNYFTSWALASGQQYADWYKDNTGYRNTSLLIVQ